ncbi:MAG: TolC family protein [Isosphaeraceae bacterium]
MRAWSRWVVLGVAVVGCTPSPVLRWPSDRDPSVARAAATPDVPKVPPVRPLDAIIRRALAENRAVRSARLNVEALRYRIPQVTALEDPMVSNTIFPIPSVAPQFSLMGYMPYDVMIAQQFPWFGTLRLRGRAAEGDVAVAIAELAEAQLDVVADVKSAYHDLAYAQRADAILEENRTLAAEFVEVARERFKTGNASQTDVLRAESTLTDIDRERERNQLNLVAARADLARLTHDDPEAEYQVEILPPREDIPVEVDRLYQLALAARPDLRGGLATIARDETAVALALKRFKPDLSVGLVYQQMERRNAVSPTAGGMPNVGLFVGFTLPVYRTRLAAGVLEAQTRVAADVASYEADRDQTLRDVKDALTRARVQRNVLELLRESNLPRARQIFQSATADYRAGNEGADYLSLLNAWREVLQIELQIAQVEAELGKAMAALELAVGTQLNEHPPDPTAHAPTERVERPRDARHVDESVSAEARPPARPGGRPDPSSERTPLNQ